jgi:hypothetical protein
MQTKRISKLLERGKATFEDPLPRPRTNLSKMTFPYQPKISLLEDFLVNIIDRFVFPHHLKRPRTVKARWRLLSSSCFHALTTSHACVNRFSQHSVCLIKMSCVSY